MMPARHCDIRVAATLRARHYATLRRRLRFATASNAAFMIISLMLPCDAMLIRCYAAIMPPLCCAPLIADALLLRYEVPLRSFLSIRRRRHEITAAAMLPPYRCRLR